MLSSYNLNSIEKNVEDYGIISLMYHRFEENKYPSTNIKIEDFRSQIEMIEKEKIDFVNPHLFNQTLLSQKSKRKVLITIDDGFLSFYQSAWPILKKRRIPFILFISTREVGKYGYMNWDQIKEIAKEDFAYIGNHSHTHEYLIDKSSKEIRDDLLTSIRIIKDKLNMQPDFFSYPFGEYSLEFKKIIKELEFKFAFGQHSGVIDDTKESLELPRFPINEKYGNLKRFKTLLKTLPFKYESIKPAEKYINDSNNPPNVEIRFFENIKNLKSINCFSNEENAWRKSEIEFSENSLIKINLKGKFTTERGRINCSLQAGDGFYRWLGMQFVIAEK